MEVRVLGPMELVDGASTVRLPRTERTLLAALASRVGERVPVDVLEEALWPENPPPSARKTLQVYVVRLRRAIGSSAIVERGGGYLLDPGVVAVDATRVAILVGEARDAIRDGDPEAAVGLLAEASAAFHGEPYEGVPDTALPAGEVARLQDLQATAVEEAVEAELACGRGQQCVGKLEAFVQANPYRERAWGLLMQALYKAGRPADALAAYGRARVVLAAELGIEPGPALRDVEHAILTHDRRLLATPASAGLGAANLPAAVSPIIGRELELAAFDRLGLADRLVTLVGVGGIGKSRLAVEIATRAVGRNEYGPYFVDLAPVGDVELVPAALAAALGVDVEPGGDVMAAVRVAVGNHCVLVVVDNCEHLLPEIAELVAKVLAGSAGVLVVATSREPLGVAGERVCPVDPLRVPPVAASIEQIEQSEAGTLFLARVPMNLVTGPLSLDELAAVGTICRHVDGIPLGLELAAARSRTLSLPELAERLGRSIDELAPSRHGVLPRHRTMRAALDWGYELLTTAAKRALRAMSVFAGGCDLAGFSAVCLEDGDPSAVEVLDELVRTSFVTVEFAGERTRYRLLEPVRQHARQLLGDDDAADRQRRHLEHYLALARSQTRDVDQLGLYTNVDVLQPELGNFRAALDWAAANADGVDAGMWLVSRLHDLWCDVHIEEGQSRTITLLRGGGGSAAARSEAAYCAAFIAEEMGDGEGMVHLLEQALVEAQAGGDRLGEARARRVLAGVYHFTDIVTARRHLDLAIPIAVDEGNDHLHAYCLIGLSQLLCASGRLDEAEERIHEVLAGPVGGDVFVDIWAHSELARVMLERGDYTRARACNTRILELSESGTDLRLQNQARVDLAQIERVSGDLDKAAAHINLIEESRPDASWAWNRYLAIARADLALLRGDYAEARTHAEHAAEFNESSINALAQCDVLRIVGDTHLALDRPGDAMVAFEQLIGLAGASFPCRRAEGHEGCAAAAAVLDRLEDARDHLAAATGIRQQTGSQRQQRPIVEQCLAYLEAERAGQRTAQEFL